jgi:hypothetical protein
MDTFGGLFIGTSITIVVVVLLLVVSKGVKRHFFPSESVDERAEAMTELLLLQARLQEEASEGYQPEGEGPPEGAHSEGGASEAKPGSEA